MALVDLELAFRWKYVYFVSSFWIFLTLKLTPAIYVPCFCDGQLKYRAIVCIRTLISVYLSCKFDWPKVAVNG